MLTRKWGLALLLALPVALAGGAGSPPWHALNPGGQWGPALQVRPAPSCPPMSLPPDWDVRSQAWADVTGDRQPECVLALWRTWRDWPIGRWAAAPTPITGNRDAQGRSAHIAVLRPRPGGRYQEVWVGSALFQPVSALTVRPDGTLVILEITYAAPQAPGQALSEWRWTSFGFRLLRRVPVQARQLALDARGWPAVR